MNTKLVPRLLVDSAFCRLTIDPISKFESASVRSMEMKPFISYKEINALEDTYPYQKHGMRKTAIGLSSLGITEIG